MDIETALKGMNNAKRKLESRDAINIPTILSEHTDRLATYTSAVEEHLAELEKELTILESDKWQEAIRDGKSPSAADTIAKHEVAKEKGEVRRLTRMVKSAWSLVDMKRSRYNHITQEMRGQI